MSKLKSLILTFSILLFSTAVQGKIFTTKKIADILDYADNDTLVVFDIDNTLIEVVQEFGGHAWFCATANKFRETGYDHGLALKKTQGILIQIEKYLKFKPVEAVTLDVINKLHDRDIKTMALTFRPISIKKVTSKHLASVGIKLSKNTVHDEEVKFDSSFGFAYGVLYSGHKNEKGWSLVKFLEKINYRPANILFIDDNQHHVEEVHETLNTKGIPTNCVLYQATFERIAGFDSARADRELLKTVGEERFNLLFDEILHDSSQRKNSAFKPDAIYKIITKEAYNKENSENCVELSSLDKESGFIHAAYGRQVQRILEKFFKDQLDTNILRNNGIFIKPEANKPGGEIFPHLYGTQAIPLTAISKVYSNDQ